MLALVVATVWLSMKVRNSEIADIPEQKPVAVGLSSRIMMTGEVFWGRYARDAALANEQGYIYQTNVNTIEEMANMISASRSYQNNVEVMNTAKQLLLATLKLGE